jgi:hypothetical protein
VPLNVRLTSASPILADVPEVAYNKTTNSFSPSPSPTSSASKAWEPVAGGGFKSSDTSTGTVTQVSADGTKIVSTRDVNGQLSITQLETTRVNTDSGSAPAIIYTRTAPVAVPLGLAEGSVSSVYTPSDNKFSPEVAALTDAKSSSGQRSPITGDTLLNPGSGGNGSSINNQFNGQGNAAGTGAGKGPSTIAGAGSGTGSGGGGQECGLAGQPVCMVDIVTPTSPYSIPPAAVTEAQAKIDSLEKSSKDKLTEIQNSGDHGGLLTWAMIPLPVTGSCSDPVMSFSGHVIAIDGFCSKMTLLRSAGEYILYLMTLFYCFKLVSESQRTV